MQGEGFFEVAQHLLANYPPNWKEAAERTAVSRVYYAAFIYSRDLMATWGCRFVEEGWVHAQVAEGLKASDHPDLVKIGRRISSLHGERKRADYKTQKAEYFDFDKIRELYADVVPELRLRWDHLTQGQKTKALAHIRAKIEAI